MTEIIKDIFQDPFKYAFGAICVIGAVALVVRYGREIWDEIIND